MKNLVRKNIEKLIPYSSARNEFMEPGNILLDANELPFNEPFNRYPDPFQMELKKKISNKKNVQTDQIFLGNGSDECIDLIIRAFCEPKVDNIITVSPSYGMYDVLANINNVEIRKVDLTEDFQLDVNTTIKSIDQNSKLIILCNPNNPTANSFNRSDIVELLQKFEGLILIDEAYIDFSEKESFLNLINDYKQLVITQTFSKSYGLAGIRLGILFGQTFVIETLNKVKYPYNVNSLTIQEGIKQLDSDNSKWIERIIKEKQNLRNKLKELSIVEKIYNSDTNYLLVKFLDAELVYNYLKDQNIIVRDRSKHRLTPNCLRITVGDESQNKVLIKKLKEL